MSLDRLRSGLAGADDGGGELREEQGPLGRRLVLFLGVLAVVDPDAEDLARAGDGREQLDRFGAEHRGAVAQARHLLGLDERALVQRFGLGQEGTVEIEA